MLRKSFCKIFIIILPLAVFFMGSEAVALLTDQSASSETITLARRGVVSRGHARRAVRRTHAPAARRVHIRRSVTPTARRVGVRRSATPTARRVSVRRSVAPVARRIPRRGRIAPAARHGRFVPPARRRAHYRRRHHYYPYRHHYYRDWYPDGRWVWAYYGVIPLAAVILYYSLEGSPVYSCQAVYDGVMYYGTVRRGGHCYIDVSGRTIGVPTYSVMVE